MAETKLAGVAIDEIETDGQDDIDPDVDGDAEIVAIELRGEVRNHGCDDNRCKQITFRASGHGQSARLRHGKLATDFFRKNVRNFRVSWNCLHLVCCRIVIERVLPTFPFEHAAVGFEVTDEFTPLHPMATTASSTSGGRCWRAELRR